MSIKELLTKMLKLQNYYISTLDLKENMKKHLNNNWGGVFIIPEAHLILEVRP